MFAGRPSANLRTESMSISAALKPAFSISPRTNPIPAASENPAFHASATSPTNLGSRHDGLGIALGWFFGSTLAILEMSSQAISALMAGFSRSAREKSVPNRELKLLRTTSTTWRRPCAGPRASLGSKSDSCFARLRRNGSGTDLHWRLNMGSKRVVKRGATVFIDCASPLRPSSASAPTATAAGMRSLLSIGRRRGQLGGRWLKELEQEEAQPGPSQKRWPCQANRLR